MPHLLRCLCLASLVLTLGACQPVAPAATPSPAPGVATAEFTAVADGTGDFAAFRAQTVTGSWSPTREGAAIALQFKDTSQRVIELSLTSSSELKPSGFDVAPPAQGALNRCSVLYRDAAGRAWLGVTGRLNLTDVQTAPGRHRVALTLDADMSPAPGDAGGSATTFHIKISGDAPLTDMEAP